MRRKLKYIVAILALIVISLMGVVMLSACDGDRGNLIIVQPSSGLADGTRLTVHTYNIAGTRIYLNHRSTVPEDALVEINYQLAPLYTSTVFVNGTPLTNVTTTIHNDIPNTNASFRMPDRMTTVEVRTHAFVTHEITVAQIPTFGVDSFTVTRTDTNLALGAGTHSIFAGTFLEINWERRYGYHAELYINDIRVAATVGRDGSHIIPVTHAKDIRLNVRERFYNVQTLAMGANITAQTVRANSQTGLPTVGDIIPAGQSLSVRENSLVSVTWTAAHGSLGRLYVSGRPLGSAVPESGSAQLNVFSDIQLQARAFVPGQPSEVTISREAANITSLYFSSTVTGREIPQTEVVTGIPATVTTLLTADYINLTWTTPIGFRGAVFVNGSERHRAVNITESHAIMVTGDDEIELRAVPNYVNLIVGTNANVLGLESFTVRDNFQRVLAFGDNLVREASYIYIEWTVHQNQFGVYVVIGGHRVTSRILPTAATGARIQITNNPSILTLETYDLLGQGVTVRFHPNGGVMTPNFQRTTIGGQTIQPPTDYDVATRANYRFTNWYTHSTNQTSETRWNFATPVFSDMWLYAGWIALDDLDAYLNDPLQATWVQDGFIYFHYFHEAWNNDNRYRVVRTWNAQTNRYVSSFVRDPEGVPRSYLNYAIWTWPEPQGEGVRIDFYRFCEDSGAIARLDMRATHMAGVSRNIPTDFRTYDHLGFLVGTQNTVGIPGEVWGRDGPDVFIDSFRTPMAEGGHKRLTRGTEGVIHVFMQRGQTVNARTSWFDDGASDYWRFHPDPGGENHRGWANTRTQNVPSAIYAEAFGEYVLLDPGREIVIGWDNINDFPIMPNAPDFVQNVGVGYQVFVSTFASSECAVQPGFGNLRGLINVLESGYFCQLGVGALWLTPINLANSYHMYDVICFYSIDPRVGTKEDFAELIDRAHNRGIRVMMDFVPNHVSTRHQWFRNAASLNPHYRNFFTIKHFEHIDSIHVYDQYGRRRPQRGVLDADWHPIRSGYYYYAMFGTSMPDLNFDYQPVRDAIIDAAKYWLEFGVDGLRLDAVKHIYNDNEHHDRVGYGQNHPNHLDRAHLHKNMHFWREFNYRVKSAFPNAFLVGENLSGNTGFLAPYFAGMDSQFNFDFHFALGSMFGNRYPGGGGARSSDINRVINQINNVNTHHRASFNDMIDGHITSNHDVSRLRHRVHWNYDHYGRRNLHDLAQNHRDATWNRVRVAGPLILSLPGISWIYYGDELGMHGHMGRWGTHAHWHTPGTNQYMYIPYVQRPWHNDAQVRQPMLWRTPNTSGINGPNMTVAPMPNLGHNRYDVRTAGFAFGQWRLHWDATNRALPGVHEQHGNRYSPLEHFRTFGRVSNRHPTMLRGTMHRIPSYWNVDGRIFGFEMRYGNSTYMVLHNMSGDTININQTWRTASHLVAATGAATANSLPPYTSVILSINAPGTFAGNFNVPDRDMRGPMINNNFGPSIVPVRAIGTMTHPDAGRWCVASRERLPL